MLIIGDRQGTYAIDRKLAAKRGFTEANIIGITELCRDIMDLPLADLQAVHRKLADEQRRIVIELEPEMPDGSFKTSILQFIEARPSVGRSDASLFIDDPDVVELFIDREEAHAALDGFIDALARLPRMTREFFGWMVDEAEQPGGIGSSGLELNADYVEAKCRAVPNLQGEIRLLTARRFIAFDQDERHVSGQFRIYFPDTGRGNFEEAFICFIKTTGLSASTLFSTMNFSAFGPPPCVEATQSGATEAGPRLPSANVAATTLRRPNPGPAGRPLRKPAPLKRTVSNSVEH